MQPKYRGQCVAEPLRGARFCDRTRCGHRRRWMLRPFCIRVPLFKAIFSRATGGTLHGQGSNVDQTTFRPPVHEYSEGLGDRENGGGERGSSRQPQLDDPKTLQGQRFFMNKGLRWFFGF